MHERDRRIESALTRNKHQNNTRMGAETIRHESTHTSFYFLHDKTNP